MGSFFSVTKKECDIKPVNDRPIIGILSLDCSDYFSKYGKSYIAASYVKFIESAGARVVPIRIDSSKEELEELFNSVNGVLFPGGGASLADSGYLTTGKILYDLAVKACDSGDRFPLWGACLGFEMLNVLTSDKDQDEILTSCDAENYSIPLDFTSDACHSKMFRSAPADIMKTLKEQNVTLNNHIKCIPVEKFWADKKISEFFYVLSTNKDRKGLEFISTIEGKKYPFFGTQWHPEKSQFEWEPKEAIDHSPDAIRIGQYMANFFVNQARGNTHKFSTEEEEEKALIYKYNPTNTSEYSTFDQCYFFQ
ncbi:gamma-glutamyl hydrolase-like [Porites lutea]|uniref:gamma-glutamyl hydrolase-like n=1 Tax=Porites lutea TaxID=51062 RepID=UPI003CC6C2B4